MRIFQIQRLFLALLLFAPSISAIAQENSQSVEALLKQLKVADTDKRVAAIKALGGMRQRASSALPALIRIANEEDPFIAAEATQAVNQIGLPSAADVAVFIERLRSGPETEWEDALALLRIAPNIEAKAAIRQFGREHLDWLLARVEKKSAASDRSFAIYMIGALWDEAAAAVPTLRKAMADSSPEVRKIAIAVLGRIGPASRSAVPELSRILDGGYDYDMCKQCAAYALGKIRAPEGVTALIHALESDEPGIRRTALNSLGQIGSPAASALPAISKFPTVDVEDQEAVALALKGIDTPESLQKLAELESSVAAPIWEKLGDLSIHYGDTMQPLLKKIGPVASRAVPHLLEALPTGNEKTRTRALYMLGVIPGGIPEKDLPKAIPIFEKLLDDPSLDLRKSVSHIAGTIGPAAAPLVPKLSALLKQKDDCHPCALLALSKIGTPEAINSVLQVVAKPDLAESTSALRTLKDVSPFPTDKAVPAIQRLLASSTVTDRANGYAAIYEFKLASDVPDTEKGLSDPDPSVRNNAMSALLSGKDISPAAEDTLIKVLTDETDDNRLQNAAAVLAKFGTAKSKPVLLQQLSSSKRPVSVNSAHALFRLSQPGDEAFQALIDHITAQGFLYHRDILGSTGFLDAIPTSMLGFLDESLEDQDFWVRVLAGEVVGSRKLTSLYGHAESALFDVAMRAMEGNIEPLFARAKAALKALETPRSELAMEFLVAY